MPRWPFRRRTRRLSTQSTGSFSDPLHPKVFTVQSRAHLAEAPYLLPKDWTDSQRLDLQHYMLRKQIRGNFLAPVQRPQAILDVACGTGRWGAEVARAFPQANVVGFDILPPKPLSASVTSGEDRPPDNYIFVEGDLTKGLPANWTNSFDFVHMRLMLLALPITEWFPAVLELQRVATSGGWVELVDSVIESEMQTPAWKTYYDWLRAISAKRNLDLHAGLHIADYLVRAGFRNVEYYRVDVPFGYANKPGGELMAANAEAGIKGLRGPMVQSGIASAEQFEAIVAQLVQDMHTVKGAVQPYYFAYGQK
jgi:ubiquinone/menaquinone biosynthesis C-methylase UbiE